MAGNTSAGTIKANNGALYLAPDADIWNGGIGIYFSQFANGISGLASDGTYVLEVGLEPPALTLNPLGQLPDALIVDWSSPKMYNPNSDAKVTNFAPGGAAGYLWAELVGVKFVRIRASGGVTNGCYVRLMKQRS